MLLPTSTYLLKDKPALDDCAVRKRFLVSKLPDNFRWLICGALLIGVTKNLLIPIFPAKRTLRGKGVVDKSLGKYL